MATLTINLNNVQPLDTLLTGISALAYSGNAGKYLKVNAAEDGFEFATASGGGITIGSAVTGGTATRVLYIDGSGNLANAAGLNYSGSYLGVGAAYTSGVVVAITATTATDKVLVVKGTTSQSGNLFESRDVANTILNKIRHDGNVVLGGDWNEFNGNNATLLTIVPNATQGTNGIAITDGGSNYVIFRREKFYTSTTLKITSYQTSPYTELLIGQNGVSVGKDGVSAASASLHVFGRSTTQVTMKVQPIASQTENLQNWCDSSGSALSAIDILGGFHPANIAVSASAQSNSIFESAGDLYWKDTGGTVRLLCKAGGFTGSWTNAEGATVLVTNGIIISET